jgi:transposase
VVRLRVVAALESGQVRTYRQAAEVFGVSERSVGSWWRAYRGGGREALAVRRIRRPGPHELISDEERGTLFQAVADYSPEELLMGGPLWTRATVRELIRMVTGVVMAERGVGKWLRRHGFTPQRPARRAYQQQKKTVRAWLEEEYPLIAARVIAARAKKVYKKVAWQRQDAARKWAKKVVRDHDAIAVEDFRPKFLAKTTMARKAADAAIAATKTALVEMGRKHSRDIRLIHPAHTTMDCAHCGARAKHALPLGERTYTCTACEAVSPRDKNSARVMLVRAGLTPAGAEGVRPPGPLVREAA